MAPTASLRKLGSACALLSLLAAAGCGRRDEAPPALTFEQLPDTTGLSDGPPIVEGFEVMRMDNGAMRVEGSAELPDGTKLQVAIRPQGGGPSLAMAHTLVERRHFGTPPLLGAYGPLPKGRYQIEVLARFTPDWQSPQVMRATADGRSLRGPGVTRARDGAPSFRLSEEVSK